MIKGYYKIKISKKVNKYLNKHSKLKQNFAEKILILQLDAYNNCLDICIIKWKRGRYRLRIGKYRFLYEIIEDEMLIYFYDADSRWDVYKN